MTDDTYLFPVSFAQKRLWFLDQLVPNNPFYNIATAIALKFPLDPTIFEKCLNEIIRRHEILRTSFRAVDGEPFQVVAPRLTLKVVVEDLRKQLPSQRKIEIERLATAEATQPFDLSAGPLIRTRLLRLGIEDWVFCLSMHHIVCDGWSIGLLFRELNSLYAAIAAGGPSPLPALAIQYSDYAVWQRRMLRGVVLEKLLDYWKQQLDQAPALQLYTDRPRPMAQTFRGAYRRVALPKGLTERIKALTRQENATLFMALLSAFNILLHRYTGQEDIVIGLPVAGRNRAEVEDLIGFFINSLVLRTDLSGNPSYRQLLRRVRHATLNAFAHQELPFEKLVEELQLERDLSRNPLFQVTFQLINAPPLESNNHEMPPPHKGQQSTHAIPDVQRGTAMFDLALDLLEGPEGLQGQFEYSTDLFETATIDRMVKHFEQLLTSIADDPNRRLSDFSMLTDQERNQVLHRWNQTHESHPPDLLLHELVESRAACDGATVAVVCGDRQLTYRELDERANQLARYLQSHGVQPDTLVGICMDRSLELVVSIFGVLKAGGAYVPMDPTYPRHRLSAMLPRIMMLLTQPALVERLPENDLPVLCLDPSWKPIRRRSKAKPKCLATPHNLAYVIYTSGSTGNPKGTLIPHVAICNHMQWMHANLPMGASHRVLQRTPLSFDASVWEFYAALMAGGCLVMAPPGSHGDCAQLVRIIREQQITDIQLVPSLLQLLLKEPGIEQCDSLRRVFCGGEKLTSKLQDLFFATLEAELHNLYGPTEATIDATSWACRKPNAHHGVPIGRPIDNVRTYVLDHHLNPVPVGVPGELYIGGSGLARGYLDRPGFTAQKFIPDPFSSDPGARLYRSGDLVRWLADGTLEFLKRLDHQVKVRGFRIELGEIEIELGRHPAVADAVVVVREDSPGDQRLVAYIVASDEVSIEDLRSFLRHRLPEFMVPGYWVMLEALPLTPNGKLDRRGLPSPDQDNLALTQTYAAPRTAFEELLADLWADVLNVQQVGIHHNFFNELGGHSLLATQLTSRIRDLFDIEVPLQRIFEAPTVAAFSAALLTDSDDHDRIEKIAAMYLKVERMSDDEVDQLLLAQSPPRVQEKSA